MGAAPHFALSLDPPIFHNPHKVWRVCEKPLRIPSDTPLRKEGNLKYWVKLFSVWRRDADGEKRLGPCQDLVGI